MNKEKTECLICKNTSFKEYINTYDFFLTGEPFQILECTKCSFKFTNPKPSKTKISSYYKSENYISHTNAKKGLVNSIYQFVRKINVKSKYKLISKFSPGTSILDIGCGTGDVLSFFQKKKWEAYGIEPDPDARRIANKKGINVFPEKEIESFQKEKFDVISLWHVLEHVHDLNKRINEIKYLIRKNGILIVALPNFNAFDAKYYKEFWAAWDVPRHLYHFDKESLNLLFGPKEFEIIKIKPMKFDSYYVSLLSEKYKNGKQNLFKAFYFGLRSNLSAIRKNEYSSLIYVLRKK